MISIVLPVVDIQLGVSDLRREVRVEELPRQTTVTLDSTVLFAIDSATLNVRARGRLSEVGTLLKSRGPGPVRVTGYTDDLGTAAHGRRLSRRRAEAVARVLRGYLPADAFPLTAVGKGEDDPAVPNKNAASRRLNRRVVVQYEKG